MSIMQSTVLPGANLATWGWYDVFDVDAVVENVASVIMSQIHTRLNVEILLKSAWIIVVLGVIEKESFLFLLLSNLIFRFSMYFSIYDYFIQILQFKFWFLTHSLNLLGKSFLKLITGWVSICDLVQRKGALLVAWSLVWFRGLI